MNQSLSIIGRVVDKKFSDDGKAFILDIEVSPIQSISYTQDDLASPITIGNDVEITTYFEGNSSYSTIDTLESVEW